MLIEDYRDCLYQNLSRITVCLSGCKYLVLSTNISQQSAPSELLYGILRSGTNLEYKLRTVEADIKL